jgi:hypothetical protein
MKPKRTDTSITLWVVPLERLAQVSLESSKHVAIIIITIIYHFFFFFLPSSSYSVGWTFQGGLAGNAGGRLFGFGVDQVRARHKVPLLNYIACKSSVTPCCSIC